MKGALVVLVCVVSVDSSVEDFFSMLGTEIANQLESAWNTIKQILKRPVRARRIYENAKKSTPPIKLTETIEDMTGIETTSINKILVTTRSSKVTEAPAYLYYFYGNQRKKLLLPVLERPRWRTRDEWQNKHRPQLGNPLLIGRGVFWGANVEGGRGASDERGWEASVERDRGSNVEKHRDKKTVTASEDDGDGATGRLNPERADEDIGVMMFI